jgi:NAD(P)-dependent dehydrogenase (short-subunit alcohol dehydrogenase family)
VIQFSYIKLEKDNNVAMKLQGKVAIITGAGRGLGQASAVAMAREGASVVIVSRTLSELKQTADIIKRGGGEALVQKADVSRPKDVESVVRKAFSRFGKVDVLMNNAAMVGPVRPLYKAQERDWNKVVNTDLRAAFLFSKAVIPSMIEQGGGKIINVTSGLGVMVMPRAGLYSIAKAGLIHLTRMLAEELKGFNIQVNGLDPGMMDTMMQEEVRKLGPEVLGQETYEEFVAMKQEGHLKPPEQVARLAVFLASGEADSLTGENGTENYYRNLDIRMS